MSKSRASIFEDAPDLDVGSFAPKTAVDVKRPPAEAVRAVAEAAQFRSREAPAPKPQPAPKRAARRYRTRRNVQIAVFLIKWLALPLARQRRVVQDVARYEENKRRGAVLRARRRASKMTAN
jgi:hypothetical protein